jgi:hypothetical protein
LTAFTFEADGRSVTRRIVGGLLGHWGVWTHSAVELLHDAQRSVASGELNPLWLTRAAAVTDMNAALFDAANRR